jgi:hypothetical protein
VYISSKELAENLTAGRAEHEHAVAPGTHPREQPVDERTPIGKGHVVQDVRAEDEIIPFGGVESLQGGVNDLRPLELERGDLLPIRLEQRERTEMRREPLGDPARPRADVEQGRALGQPGEDVLLNDLPDVLGVPGRHRQQVEGGGVVLG